MNYAFQVSQSSYRTTEESAFRKRWMYRPKSNQSRPNVRSQPKREEQWEPLCGWNCPEETESDLIDIEGWIKKSQNSKKGAENSLVESFLYSVLVTCPSIYDFDEFKEASLAATTCTPSPNDDSVEVGLGTDETSQAGLETTSISGQQQKGKNEKIDIESLHSASTISCKSHSSGEIQNPETGILETETQEKTEDVAVGRGHINAEENDERTMKAGVDLKEAEKESKISRSHSNLKSKSASTVRPFDKAERRIASAQSDPKGAGGDGIKHSSLRKNSLKKSPAKKVTLNPAPIEISYTEEGLFEVTLPPRLDEDPSSQDNQEHRDEKNDTETSHRISLSTPDKKAWEQSLKQQVSFELPVLSSLSVGDLLSSTPRLEQFVDSTDSKLTFIKALYDKTSVYSDSESVSKTENNSVDQSSLSNLPSLHRDGSPQNLVSSPSTERRTKQASAVGQDDASKVMAPSVTKSNGQSPSPNRDKNGSHLEGCRRGLKGDASDHKLIQQRGPPGFRPPSNKTPLQRAMENAHKKIYGEHHYLFSQQNTPNGQVEHPSYKDARLRQTKSARTTPKVNNAYVWKERLDNSIKHQRTIPSHAHSVSLSHRRSIVCNHCTKLQLDDYGPSQLAPLPTAKEPLQPIGEFHCGPESAKLVARLSASSPTNQTIDPSVQILSKVESRHAQLQKSYSELFRLARQKKLQLRKGGEKCYTLSDFEAPLEKTNVLRTQRGKVGQR